MEENILVITIVFAVSVFSWARSAGKNLKKYYIGQIRIRNNHLKESEQNLNKASSDLSEIKKRINNL